MASVSNSLTAVGAGTSLRTARKNKTVNYGLSGTYAATMEYQRARTPDGSAWERVAGPFSTANATVAGTVLSVNDTDLFRWLCTAFTSGTVVATASDVEAVDTVERDQAGNAVRVVRESGEANIKAQPYACGSAITLTPELHAGRTGLLDTAAGSTVTLPKATGSGAKYKFRVSVLATSNSHIVKVADAVDVMQGIILAGGDTATTVVNHWATGATSDTITLNRSTTGSTQLGEWLELEDAAPGIWQVNGFIEQTGTEATPFSATV